VTCLVFYFLFAKGEIQDWAKEIKTTRLWRWDIVRLRTALKLKMGGGQIRAVEDELLRQRAIRAAGWGRGAC
jgi:hypothetical protein